MLLTCILLLFFFLKDKSVSIHSDNKRPAAAAHSLPAELGTNANSPPYQMEAAVIETLSSAPALCRTRRCTHTAAAAATNAQARYILSNTRRIPAFFPFPRNFPFKLCLRFARSIVCRFCCVLATVGGKFFGGGVECCHE